MAFCRAKAPPLDTDTKPCYNDTRRLKTVLTSLGLKTNKNRKYGGNMSYVGVVTATSVVGPSTRVKCTPVSGTFMAIETELKGVALHIRSDKGMNCFAKGDSVGLGTSPCNIIASGKIVDGKIIVVAENDMIGSQELATAMNLCGFVLGNDGWEKPLFSRTVVRNPSTIVSHQTREL